MSGIRPNQHVTITGLGPEPIEGVARFTDGSDKTWGVWIPGPHFDDGYQSGFFCYCPPDTLTPIDKPDHEGRPFGQFVQATCEHCAVPATVDGGQS